MAEDALLEDLVAYATTPLSVILQVTKRCNFDCSFCSEILQPQFDGAWPVGERTANLHPADLEPDRHQGSRTPWQGELKRFARSLEDRTRRFPSGVGRPTSWGFAVARSRTGWYAGCSARWDRVAAKAVAIGVSVTMLAVAVGGDVPDFPRRSSGPAGKAAAATPPPGQRWAAAADGKHIVGTPNNHSVPQSLRGRYPAIQWKPQVNQASVEVGPTPPVRGYDAVTSAAAQTQLSAYEKTYDNADGTQTTEFSSTPVNYRAPDGSWKPIETTVVPVEAGGAERGWRNTADAVGVRLAGSASASELATVTFDDRHAIAYSMVGASGGVAEAAGSTVTYRGVAPGVDLKRRRRRVV
jgi:hypothetical protein